MDKTTKIYSAPTLVAAGSVVTRTLGTRIVNELEAGPMDLKPYFETGI